MRDEQWGLDTVNLSYSQANGYLVPFKTFAKTRDGRTLLFIGEDPGHSPSGDYFQFVTHKVPEDFDNGQRSGVGEILNLYANGYFSNEKDGDEIMKNQEDIVSILHRWYPVIEDIVTVKGVIAALGVGRVDKHEVFVANNVRGKITFIHPGHSTMYGDRISNFIEFSTTEVLGTNGESLTWTCHPSQMKLVRRPR